MNSLPGPDVAARDDAFTRRCVNSADYLQGQTAFFAGAQSALHGQMKQCLRLRHHLAFETFSLQFRTELHKKGVDITGKMPPTSQ